MVILSTVKWLVGGAILLSLAFFVNRYYAMKVRAREDAERIRGLKVKERVMNELAENDAKLRRRLKEIETADKRIIDPYIK